jgi:hypothetical protein
MWMRGCVNGHGQKEEYPAQKHAFSKTLKSRREVVGCAVFFFDENLPAAELKASQQPPKIETFLFLSSA